MIESNQPEENKTSDVEMFFSQFNDGEPTPKTEQPDAEFDKQAEKRFEPEAPKQTFKQAFATARKGGGKVFEFNGKKYTTAMKGEKPAAKTVAKPTAVESKPASSIDNYAAAADAGIARDQARSSKPSAMFPPVKPSAKPGQKYNIASGAPVDDEPAPAPQRTADISKVGKVNYAK